MVLEGRCREVPSLPPAGPERVLMCRIQRRPSVPSSLGEGVESWHNSAEDQPVRLQFSGATSVVQPGQGYSLGEA